MKETLIRKEIGANEKKTNGSLESKPEATPQKKKEKQY